MRQTYPRKLATNNMPEMIYHQICFIPRWAVASAHMPRCYI